MYIYRSWNVQTAALLVYLILSLPEWNVRTDTYCHGLIREVSACHCSPQDDYAIYTLLTGVECAERKVMLNQTHIVDDMKRHHMMHASLIQHDTFSFCTELAAYSLHV